MNQNLMNETITAVKIILKDGTRLCGWLLDSLNNLDKPLQTWNFVSNLNLNEYQQTLNEKLIEILPTESIAYIDPFLK